MSEDPSEKAFFPDEKRALANVSPCKSSLTPYKLRPRVVRLFRELFSWPAFKKAGSALILLALAVGTYFLHGKRISKPFIVLTSAFMFLALEIFLVVAIAILSVKRSKVLNNQRNELCRLVMAHKPGFVLSNWDNVTIAMNEYLRRKELWHTSSCFPNGRALYIIFRTEVYLPFKNSKFDDEPDVALLSDTANAYESSACETQTLSEKTQTLYAGNEEQKLPVEVYRSKMSWALALAAKPALFGCVYHFCLTFYYNWYFKLAAVVGQLALVALSLYNKVKLISVTQVGQFLNTVKDLEPWENNSSWDDIAKVFNRIMGLQKNNYIAADFFYDGEDSRRCFESILKGIISGSRKMPEFMSLANELQAACGLDVAESA
ncbi:LAFA_0A02366g1_1 [Lachancea sp. 'fantastica']|nr:LAFA_0A02366g1_1 [Lachancea sp. 'fantastica']